MYKISGLKNSKIIQLLQKLTTTDLDQFHLFLQSPFFVAKGSNELALFEYLMQLYPKFEDKAIEKSFVFKQLFKGKTYKPIKMYQLMSSLVKLLEEFILHQNIKTQKYEQQINNELVLYDYYQQFGIAKWVKAQEKKLLTIQEEVPFKSTNYYYHQYQTVERIVRFDSYVNKRRSNIPLSEVVDNYSIYFCTNLLILLSLHYVDQNIYQEIDAIPNIEAVDHLLALFKVESAIPIQVHRQAIRMLQEQSEEQYHIFKDLLRQHLSLFPFTEARNLLTYARSFANRQMGKGKHEYRQEYFELYQLGINNEILYYDGKMLAADLKNIVAISLLLEKYDWATQFVESHKERIWGDNSAEIYHFNLAEIAFKKGDYKEALDLIYAYNFADLFYELSARRLELKIMYELEEDMVLDSKMNAFKVYIYRNKVLSTSLKQQNGNFIKVLSRLTRTIPGNPKHIEKVEKSLSNLGLVGERRWLKNKIAILKK